MDMERLIPIDEMYKLLRRGETLTWQCPWGTVSMEPDMEIRTIIIRADNLVIGTRDLDRCGVKSALNVVQEHRSLNWHQRDQQ